jgi:putative sterol carrier protein
MDLERELKLHEGEYDEMCELVEAELEKEFPEEMKFIDELPSEDWQKVWNVIVDATQRAYALGKERRA